MDNNLVVRGINFNLLYSDVDGSVRRDVSRGVNLPYYLRIRHQDVTDTKTKRLSRQSQIQVERHELSSDGVTILPFTATLTLRYPKDTGITSEESRDPLWVLINLLNEDTNPEDNLALMNQIFTNNEQ